MRRVLAALLCLMLVAAGVSASAEEPSAASATGAGEVFAIPAGDGRSMLIGYDGTELTGRSDYALLYQISDDECPPERRLFAGSPVRVGTGPADEEGYTTYALIDATGRRLTDAIYGDLTHRWRSGIVTFYQGDLMGALDERGNVLLEAKYGGIVPDGEGGYLVTPEESFVYDRDGYAYVARLYRMAPDGAMTDTGVTTVPYLYGQLSDGLLAVTTQVGKEWLTGYVNARGEFEIEPQFDGADAFRDGYATARLPGGGLTGLLRPDGSWAIEPSYDAISDTWSGAASICAVRGKSVDILDRKTLKVIASYSFPKAGYVYAYEMNARAITVGADSNISVYGMDGKLLFSLPEKAGAYVNGSFSASEGVPERLILTAGEWPTYRTYIVDYALKKIAGPFRELSALWWRDGEGRYMAMDYEIQNGADGPSVDYDTYRYGLIDQDGSVLLPTVYEQLMYLGGDRYWVKYADVYGVVDEAGAWYFHASEYEELMD